MSIGSWGAKGTQVVVLLVLARALAPAQFGILAIAALTYNVLQAVSELGVADALTYLADQIEEASRTALTMVVLAGALLSAALWVASPAIAAFFHSPEAAFVLRGFALSLPFDTAAQVPIGRLTRSLSFSRRAVTDTLPSIIGAAVTVGVVLGGFPLTGLVAGQIAGGVANLAVAMLVGPRCRPGWSRVMARRLFRYGGYLSAANLVNLGLLNVDYIMVGHFLGPTALGLYSLAYRICFMPYLSVAVVANGAVFPYYCRLPSRQAVADAADDALCVIMGLSMPWFAGLALFAGDISLLGSKWAGAVGAVRFLAVYGLLLSLILSFLQVLKAGGRSDLVFAGRILHLAALTAALLITVHHGITIVAVDQAVVAGAMAVIIGIWVVRYASMRPAALARAVGLPLVGALGMAALVVPLGHLHALRTGPTAASLIILASLALAVFACILAVIMPRPLRAGWAALRGVSNDTPATSAGLAAGKDVVVRTRSHEPRGESSYRDSHMGQAEAHAYDEAVRNPATAMALDWQLEQRLLTDILGSWAGPGCRAADFACGTGRVLEFLKGICPDPVGIDISPSMLALARRRCPDTTLICGDVTLEPDLVPGTFDVITAFRFFLNADTSLRADALDWMRSAVRTGGLVVANFHLTPRSIRGAYLRLHAAEQLPMFSTAQAEELFTAHGFTIRQFVGYSFLPYRRDGRKLFAPAARRAIELKLAGRKPLLPVAGSFLVVAEATPRGNT